MKTGKPTRLSEKLNEDLEKVRVEHVGLMASQLKNFRDDIEASVKLARDTIETDTETFLDWTGRAWQNHINKITQMMRLSPWIVVGASTVIIVAMLGLTLIWSWKLAEIRQVKDLRAMGLQTVQQDDVTYLILNPNIARFRTCTMDQRTVSCIRVDTD